MLAWFWLVLACGGGGSKDQDTAAVEGIDQDQDGYPAGEDCDDRRPDISPAAAELCDGLDNDCDGRIDDEDDGIEPAELRQGYRDADADGAGDDAQPLAACELPGGYVPQGGDCNDGDPAVGPFAPEVCNGIDDNCDDLVDDADPLLDLTTRQAWYADDDGDGFGAAAGAVQACAAPPGTVDNRDDCDDSTAARSPDAPEACNEVDDDCDGLVDDDDTLGPGQGQAWFADEDRDGVGAGSPQAACEAPAGFVAVDGDCDDDNRLRYPGATEVCSGLDEDCDELVDAEDPSLADGLRAFVDSDEDSYGDGPAQTVCALSPGLVSRDGDCDDEDPAAFPGGREVCGGGDEDCDGRVDDADPSLDPTTTTPFFADGDADGYGAEPLGASCRAPGGSSPLGGDCDDTDPTRSPRAVEVCGGGDQDCDGLDDEADPSLDPGSALTVYADRDGDGAGDPALPDLVCALSDGFSLAADDCDDRDAEVGPGAAELCNGRDDDCDALIDDGDPSLDFDRSPRWSPDSDLDGYGDRSREVAACVQPPGTVPTAGDCNDRDRSIYPGAPERCDGIDGDCDDVPDDRERFVQPAGALLAGDDLDGDGYAADEPTFYVCSPHPGVSVALGDCDDLNPTRNPGAAERCAPLDEDCDGLINEADPSLDPADLLAWGRDADADGWGDALDLAFACAPPLGYAATSGDCDDTRPEAFPGALEVCNGGLDDDCDGLADDDDDLDPSVLLPFFLDADGDGDGGPTALRVGCTPPVGFQLTSGDCNDTNPRIGPSQPEACNGGVDDNCNGLADDADPTLDPSTALALFLDNDADGVGGEPILACRPAGRSFIGGDCDDFDARVRPGEPERCDGKDTGCRGPAWSGDAGLITFTALDGTSRDLEAADTLLLDSSGLVELCGPFRTRLTALASDLTLQGYDTTLDAGGAGSVITLATGGRLTLRDLTLTGGDAPSGGAIFVAAGGASVHLERVEVVANAATRGGALAGTGLDLTLTDTVVYGNFAEWGAAIDAIDSDVRCEGSAIVANRAGPGGAAVALDATSTLLASACDFGTGPEENLPWDVSPPRGDALDLVGVVELLCDPSGCF